MVSKEDEVNNQSLLNTEKLKEFIFFYKFPLILSSIGIILLVLAVGLSIKSQYSSDVVFSTQASPSAQVKIRIDIQGAVISPGVYSMEEGSRVADALVVSGGLSADADRDWVAKSLNRAAKLIDGGKIYIPSVTEVTSGKSENRKPKTENTLSDLSNPSNLLGVSTGKVNVNTASQIELEALSGIGPVTASKIISGRPYQTIEELKDRKIISKSLYEKLKDLLTVY